jgi:hypothetical protein
MDKLVELFKRGQNDDAIYEVAENTMSAFLDAEAAVAAADARFALAEAHFPT